MKICVDPGHGMSNRSPGVFDPGATHTEAGIVFREADIALKYGLTLKDELRSRQVEVFMTRDDSEDHAPVGARAANAKAAGCDRFVSLHLNDVDDDSANGAETLFRGNDDKPLAAKVQAALIGATGLRDRGLKQRTDLAVLKFDGVAVLVEPGFIANDRDRATLLNPQIRASVCKAIADAVLA